MHKTSKRLLSAMSVYRELSPWPSLASGTSAPYSEALSARQQVSLLTSVHSRLPRVYVSCLNLAQEKKMKGNSVMQFSDGKWKVWFSGWL